VAEAAEHGHVVLELLVPLDGHNASVVQHCLLRHAEHLRGHAQQLLPRPAPLPSFSAALHFVRQRPNLPDYSSTPHATYHHSLLDGVNSRLMYFHEPARVRVPCSSRSMACVHACRACTRTWLTAKPLDKKTISLPNHPEGVICPVFSN
jgi:hypothetical protein